jgi:hypothetical protein
MDQTTAERVKRQISKAIQCGNVDEFQSLVKEYPEWPDIEDRLGYPHDLSVDSLQTFKAFVEHFPQTKDWDCGHVGNPIGIAAMRGDIPLLKYLLEDLGHKANNGRFFYSPVI